MYLIRVAEVDLNGVKLFKVDYFFVLLVAILFQIIYFQLIEAIVCFVDKINCYEKVVEIIAPFIRRSCTEIKIQSKLLKALESLPNAVFIYVANRIRQLPEMNDDVVQQAFIEWMKVIDHHRVRFVWLLIENPGEIIILSKGAKFHTEVSECLRTGWQYAPSIDYIDSRAFQLLTFEMDESNDPLNTMTDNVACSGSCQFGQERQILFNGVNYTYAMMHGSILVKLPWAIQSKKNGNMFIFYLKKRDCWIYSKNSNIQQVYHQLDRE